MGCYRNNPYPPTEEIFAVQRGVEENLQVLDIERGGGEIWKKMA